MALDPKKLATYMSTVEPRSGRKLPVVPQGSGKSQHYHLNSEELKERLEHGAEIEDEQVERLLDPKVSYMELVENAKGFACGACVSFERSSSLCEHPDVLAPVSGAHGCCNLFWPVHGEPAFPPKTLE